jgi:hypothetical protein
MGIWHLVCPNGGEYKCEGHYVGGHGKPFSLHCSTIKTIKAPKQGGCVDAPLADSTSGDLRSRITVSDNPRTRGFLPHGLTSCEKAHRDVRRKLASCIKETEKRCCGRLTKHYDSCSCNPVAVCRASVPCPN